MSPASTFQSYFTDMKCALDLLDQNHAVQKMSTGSAEIDSLIEFRRIYFICSIAAVKTNLYLTHFYIDN